MATFISRIADHLINADQALHEHLVLLPNQRAELFLRERIRAHLGEDYHLFPLFLTVDQFISEAADLLVVEPLNLLVDLHRHYTTVRAHQLPSAEPEDLGAFLAWGQTLLADFGEIDRYLLNPEHVLGDLYNVQKLAEWNLEPEQETAMMRRYSDFISLLPQTYGSFTQSLLERGEAYSGLAARHLAEHPEKSDRFLKRSGVTSVVVAGLNALNTAELQVLKHLKNTVPTTFLWDIDPYYVDMPEHEAGHFFRLHQGRSAVFGDELPISKGMQSDWTSKPKRIQPVGASQYTGQAKAVAETLLDWHAQGIPVRNMAVILADESLLNPVLNFLPGLFDKVNITMGYPLEQTALAATLKLWLGTVEYALKNPKASGSWTFHHRSLSALFTDPLFNRYWNVSEEGPMAWHAEIVKGNKVFTSAHYWHSKAADSIPAYAGLFVPGDGPAVVIALQNWLKHVGATEKENPILQNTAYELYTLLEQLLRTLRENVPEPLVWTKLVRQQLRSGTIDFVGEPLEGLQVMGILESRTLDFSHVILAGVNEGILPSGRSFNSLLPYDVKQHYGLPTYEEKDAVYAYHFYRILQRCEEAVITFNTDSGAMGGGEPSRFLVQIEHELKGTAAIVLPRKYLQGTVAANSVSNAFRAERTPAAKPAIADWMARGISASSLNELSAMPDLFYKKRLVRVIEEDEVEENMSAMVMGNLVHKGLETVYKEVLDRPLPAFDVANWTERALQAGIDYLIQEEGYSKTALFSGRNLLTVEVCRKMIHQFLSFDHERRERQQIVLRGIEKKLDFEMVHPSLGLPLKFIGFIDRVEECNGVLTIWDYKTGSIGESDLSLGAFEDLWKGKKGKPLQILLYSWLLYKMNAFDQPMPWKAGMFKLQSGQPEDFLRGNALPKKSEITEELLLAFEQELMDRLEAFYLSDEPFVEKPKFEFK
jgi:hypothetical protein